MITDDVWMTRMSRPGWGQIGAIVGAFAGAIAIGGSLASVAKPGAELYAGASCFLFLFIFMGGYGLWTASATSLLSGHLFRGVWDACFKFIWRRRRSDLESMGETLLNNLRDTGKLREIVVKIRQRSVLFLVMGLVAGFGFGLVGGLFATQLGLFSAWALYAFAGTLYGWGLARLARAGYLPLPAEM